MPTRTRSIHRARSEGYLETVKAQKKIEYLEDQLGKINVALNILFQDFGTWPDEESFQEYGFPYLVPDNNYVKLEDVKKMLHENKIKEMAYNAYFNGRKQKTKKKSRTKQRKLVLVNALTNAMTRRKKQVKGTLLGSKKNRLAVKMVGVKKQEKSPIEYSQHQSL